MFAILALWVIIFIGLVNPKRLQSLSKDKPVTRAYILLMGLLGTTILIIIGVFTAPDIEHNSAAPSSLQQTTQTVTESEPKYEIISDDKRGNITRKVQVELPSRLSKQQLEIIANQIKDADSTKYERTFIMYRIQGEKSVAAWATIRFDPNLDAKLIGLSADDFKKLLALKLDVDGEVIGQWVSPNGMTDHIDVIYKKNKQYFKKDFYLDATMKPHEMVRDGDTFRYKDLAETQYFVINSNGDLEYHGSSGNVYLAKKLDSY